MSFPVDTPAGFIEITGTMTGSPYEFVSDWFSTDGAEVVRVAVRTNNAAHVALEQGIQATGYSSPEMVSYVDLPDTASAAGPDGSTQKVSYEEVPVVARFARLVTWADTNEGVYASLRFV